MRGAHGVVSPVSPSSVSVSSSISLLLGFVFWWGDCSVSLLASVVVFVSRLERLCSCFLPWVVGLPLAAAGAFFLLGDLVAVTALDEAGAGFLLLAALYGLLSNEHKGHNTHNYHNDSVMTIVNFFYEIFVMTAVMTLQFRRKLHYVTK